MSSNSSDEDQQGIPFDFPMEMIGKIFSGLSVFYEYKEMIVKRHLEYKEKREESIEECINKIKQDPILIKFMNEISNDPLLLRLFTTQLKVLTSTPEGDNTFLTFLLCEEKSQSNLNILKTNASTKISTLEKRYYIIKPWFFGILQNYFGINMGISDDFDQKEIQNLNELLDRIVRILNDARKKEFKKEVMTIFEDFLCDPTTLIKDIGIIGQAHFVEDGINHSNHLIKVLKIDMKKYLEKLTQLIEMKILRYWITISWCSSHQNSPYSVYLFGHDNIPQINCPTCGKRLQSATILTLHPNIAEFIMNKNGFISIILGWILEKNDIKWESEIYNNENETDILCGPFKKKKYVVIETKTFTTDNMNPRVINSNISGKSNQIVKNIKSWRKEGKNISGGIFYCNYFGKDFLNAKNDICSNKEELDNYNISIMGIDDLSNFISEIKKKLIE